MTKIIDNEEVTLHLVLGNPGMANNLFNRRCLQSLTFLKEDVQGRILVITNWSDQ